MAERPGATRINIRTRVDRAMETAARAVSHALGIALIVAVIINVANVVGRYGFNRPIQGADEVEIYLMIALAFFGALVAHARRTHLRMDVLARRFPSGVAAFVKSAEALISVAVCGLMSIVSISYTTRIWHLGNHSENADLPMWLPHGILAVAFAAMTLVGIVRLFVPRSAV